MYFTLLFVYIFQDAFSLLAYSDPWSSPVGYQLQPVQRESVCAALNSAILGTVQYIILGLLECLLVLL